MANLLPPPAPGPRAGTSKEMLGGSSLQRQQLEAVSALLVSAREHVTIARSAFVGALRDVRAAEVLLGEPEPADGPPR